MRRAMYQELGQNYRFFLTWRHAIFAGNFIVIWGALSLWMTAFSGAKPLMPFVAGAAAPFGFIFMLLDSRVRHLFEAAYEVGPRMERVPGRGIYSQLEKKRVVKNSKGRNEIMTHAKIMRRTYICTSCFFIVLFIMSCFLAFPSFMPYVVYVGEFVVKFY